MDPADRDRAPARSGVANPPAGRRTDRHRRGRNACRRRARSVRAVGGLPGRRPRGLRLRCDRSRSSARQRSAPGRAPAPCDARPATSGAPAPAANQVPSVVVANAQRLPCGREPRLQLHARSSISMARSVASAAAEARDCADRADSLIVRGRRSRRRQRRARRGRAATPAALLLRYARALPADRRRAQ